MADIKPWMRRAAEQFLNRPNQLLLSQEHASRYIAEAIAAHAPPEINTEALEHALFRSHINAPESCDGCQKAKNLLNELRAWKRERGDPK